MNVKCSVCGRELIKSESIKWLYRQNRGTRRWVCRDWWYDGLRVHDILTEKQYKEKRRQRNGIRS